MEFLGIKANDRRQLMGQSRQINGSDAMSAQPHTAAAPLRCSELAFRANCRRAENLGDRFSCDPDLTGERVANPGGSDVGNAACVTSVAVQTAARNEAEGRLPPLSKAATVRLPP